MPAQRLSMRKAREILRLRWGQGLSARQVARSCNCSPSTVTECVTRAQAAGLGWPLPADLDDAGLEARLYPGEPKGVQRPSPDFAYIHRELRRSGVTLQLLWQEYRHAHPEHGYGYSQFCELYRKWCQKLDVVMRQTYRGGEKMFVDYAGVTVPIVDGRTGEVTEASVFVAALGASSFTYTEVVRGEDLRSWIHAHLNALRFFGGVTEILVPDNLRSGVKHACFYDPEINPTYHDFAEYHDTVVIPARKGHPRDKAKVENAVQQVERWVLAPVRNQQFFSIAEANRALQEPLQQLNDRPLSQLDGTRRSLFEEFDRPALKSLPVRAYEIPEWKRNVAVHIDHHVEFDRHYYSVPYRYTRKRVDVRATGTTVEILYQGQRIASHPRSFERGRHTTQREHRPQSHRDWQDWSPERIIRWASTVGPKTADAVRRIMESKRHPEQGFRASLGVIRLGKKYGTQRLEDACDRAFAIAAVNYQSIQSILKTGFDQQPPPAIAPATPIEHDNVRGPEYYN